MRRYFLVVSLLMIRDLSCVRTIENALLVLGGGSKIYVDNHDQSPIVESFEIFGCSSSFLPDYPTAVFGTNMIWMEGGQGEKLMVCGGADWQKVYQECYSWNPR